MRRKLILAVLILLAFVLQGTVFQTLSIASIVPNLLLILTVSFGFYAGKEGRTVRRIFLRTADRYFLWKYDWILCPDLYVYRFWKRFSV